MLFAQKNNISQVWHLGDVVKQEVKLEGVSEDWSKFNRVLSQKRQKYRNSNSSNYFDPKGKLNKC